MLSGYKLLPKVMCKYISSEKIDNFLRYRETYDTKWTQKYMKMTSSTEAN